MIKYIIAYFDEYPEGEERVSHVFVPEDDQEEGSEDTSTLCGLSVVDSKDDQASNTYWHEFIYPYELKPNLQAKEITCTECKDKFRNYKVTGK